MGNVLPRMNSNIPARIMIRPPMKKKLPVRAGRDVGDELPNWSMLNIVLVKGIRKPRRPRIVGFPGGGLALI